MDLAKLPKMMEKFAIDNSPAILTAVGVAGTAATAYLTGKASFKAAKIIADAQFKENIAEKGHPLTTKEKTFLVWKQFILPAAVGTLTCAAVVGANRISTKRMAALAAGYTLLGDRFEEYRDKIKEKLGVNKEQAAGVEISQQRVDNNSPSPTLIISEGKTMFRDEFSGRYFESTMEDVKKAMNDVNYRLIADEYATVSDFYERIGLPPTMLSDEFGWLISGNEKFDIKFNAIIAPDQRPCIVLEYNCWPVRNGGHTGGSSQKIHAV